MVFRLKPKRKCNRVCQNCSELLEDYKKSILAALGLSSFVLGKVETRKK